MRSIELQDCKMAIRAVFVGGGKMAEAMVNGMRRMLPAGAAFEFEVEVCDPNETRADVFGKQGIKTWSSAKKLEPRHQNLEPKHQNLKPQNLKH